MTKSSTQAADQQVIEELTRVTRERDQARRELARRGCIPSAPPRGDQFDDIRRAYIQALLRLPMFERAREMTVLGEALAADEAGTDRRHGHAVSFPTARNLSDADLDADHLDLDDDSIDD
jgi:hypothetical protein